MILSKADYETITLQILNIVFSGKPPTIDMIPGCSQIDFDNILEQCVNNKFIEGLEIFRSGDGQLHYDCVFQPYVTFDGLSFIESIQQSKALDIATSANNISISAKLKANKSFIISLITLLVTLIINADKIVHNIQKILFYLNTR